MHNQAIQRLISGMIRAFGDGAREEALRCAARFAEIDDTRGEDIWRQIAGEIERRGQQQAGSSAS
jgi:hypothetical protein